MGFDRSKFKPTPMVALKAQENDHETKRPSGGGGNRVGYITIEDGDNKLRFFPCHPDGGGKTYSEAKCVTFLSILRQVYVDGKAIEGKKELKRVPVFNAKVHGNYSTDLVEEYLKVAKNKAIPAFTDNSERQDIIWKYVTGMNGVKPSDTWVVYASKFEGGAWGPIGILELKKSITTQLKDRAMEYVGEDPISPDPFTDPNEGIAVIINKSGKGLDTEYKVRLDKKREGKTEMYIETPLTDDQLEAFSKLDPLYKTYVKVFKRSDLEAQIEGLDNFEKDLASKKLKDKSGDEFTANIGVFQYDEFQLAMDKLLDLVPEATPESTKDEEDGGTVEDTEEEEIIEPIKIKKAAPKKVVEEKVVAPPVKKEVVVEPSPAATSASDRLAEIRARLGKK